MNATAQQLREKIKEEFKKCAVDPAYFLSRYSYIQHPIRGHSRIAGTESSADAGLQVTT